MMAEEVFQLHVATSPYATHSLSLYKTRDKLSRIYFLCWCATVFFPCWCAKGSSFPAGVQSLLLCKRVFFLCWCLTWSSFTADALQISYLPWQPNKMVSGHETHKLSKHFCLATGHETHKLGRQPLNDIQTAKFGTHHFTEWLWRKCNLPIFP